MYLNESCFSYNHCERLSFISRMPQLLEAFWALLIWHHYYSLFQESILNIYQITSKFSDLEQQSIIVTHGSVG